MNEYVVPLILSLFVGAILFGGFGILMDESNEYFQAHESQYKGFIANEIKFIYENYQWVPILFLITAFVGTYMYVSYKRGAY